MVGGFSFFKCAPRLGRAGIISGGFFTFIGIGPGWHHNPTTPVVLLGSGDDAHGVVEGQAEDLDMEVDGIAS